MADDHDRAERAAMRAELEELRRHVALLDKELKRAQGHLSLTMRAQLRCPACGCRKIAHALEVLDGTANGRDSMALFQPSIWSTKKVGEVEAYVCTKCGLLEWYVKDPGSLEEHEKYMRILDGSTPDAPYR